MQPLCDLTAKKFGAAVSMLVVLPVETGAIEMRRYVALLYPVTFD